MSTTNSKVIGVRLPMDEYLKVISTAAAAKMNVSDFILLKLYAPADASALPLQQARQRVDQLTDQSSALKLANTELVADNNRCKQHSNALEQDQKTAQRKALQQQTQIDQLTRLLAQEQASHLATQQRLWDLRQALAEVHDDSGAFGGMGDKYWKVVDEFVPRP